MPTTIMQSRSRTSGPSSFSEGNRSGAAVETGAVLVLGASEEGEAKGAHIIHRAVRTVHCPRRRAKFREAHEVWAWSSAKSSMGSLRRSTGSLLAHCMLWASMACGGTVEGSAGDSPSEDGEEVEGSGAARGDGSDAGDAG